MADNNRFTLDFVLHEEYEGGEVIVEHGQTNASDYTASWVDVHLPLVNGEDATLCGAVAKESDMRFYGDSESRMSPCSLDYYDENYSGFGSISHSTCFRCLELQEVA